MTDGLLIAGIPVYPHLKECEALDARIQAEDESEIKRQTAALYLDYARLPPGAVVLRDYLQRYQIDDHNREACGVTAQWFREAHRTRRMPVSAFALTGPPGSGKSILAACVARSVAEDCNRVLWWNVPNELGRIRDAWDKPGTSESLTALLTEPLLLVLDDLGREKPAAWVVDQVLYPVLESRLNRRRPIIVTTNETRQTLGDRYMTTTYRDGSPQTAAAAMLSRLDAMIACWVPMTGPDRRKADAAWMTKDKSA